VFDPADGSDTVVPGDVDRPGRYLEPVTLWATRDALVVADHGRLDRIALRGLTRSVIADDANEDYVKVDRGAVTYLADGDRPWLWDASTGARTSLASLRGGEEAVGLTRSPAGELVVVGEGQLVVAAGTSPCETVLAIAGDVALCRDGSRTLAIPLDAPAHAVGLDATTLSFDGTWASGFAADGGIILEPTEGGGRQHLGSAGAWGLDRDVYYYLDDRGLVARDAASGADRVIARSARAFAPVPGGGVAYAVPGDGVYVAP
jgi:hypothetical protein